MCEFISWKEINGQVLFLTYDDIYNTKEGKRLQAYTVSADFFGHGAIDYYYDIEGSKGTNKECTKFSSPKNFPAVIADAIKAGKMAGLSGFFPKGLLLNRFYNDYDARYKVMDNDYDAKRRVIDNDYNAKCRVINDSMWNLFTNVNNRSEAWR